MDKKSQHVGDHGGRYVDNDGLSKQFTYIDHDKKSKMSGYNPSEEEKERVAKELRESIQEMIDKILALPAISFVKSGNLFAESYIHRDIRHGIIWNEKVVRDALSINHDMRYTVWNSVWKNTVQEKYWFEEMSYEDILAGKWKKWM